MKDAGLREIGIRHVDDRQHDVSHVTEHQYIQQVPKGIITHLVPQIGHKGVWTRLSWPTSVRTMSQKQEISDLLPVSVPEKKTETRMKTTTITKSVPTSNPTTQENNNLPMNNQAHDQVQTEFPRTVLLKPLSERSTKKHQQGRVKTTAAVIKHL